MKRIKLALLGFLALPLTAANAPAGSDLVVTLTGVERPTGAVYVSLCRRAEFMTPSCYKAAGRKVTQTGNYVIPFRSVAPGTYALLAFHDVNGNKKLDRNNYGAPIEPTGVSGSPAQAGQLPQFARSAFVVENKPLNLSLGLR